jgi:hypothetical protein
MGPRFSRRTVLKVLGSAALPVPVLGTGCLHSGDTEIVHGFLTDGEKRGLSALANVVIPPEGVSPGGGDLGAAAFVERLLTAFEVDPPAIYADGPFSGRAPLPDGKGGTTGASPPNDFLRFTPLDRVSEHAWRIRIHGSAAVPGGTLNDPIVPPVVGLRDLVRKALDDATKFAGAPLETLPQQQIVDAFGSLDRDVQAELIDLVTQAAFAAPEYGGNPNLAGWKLAMFEGDVHPLGYSLFDESAGVYRERPDAPLTTANPGPDPAPLDAGTTDLLNQVVAFANGKVF